MGKQKGTKASDINIDKINVVHKGIKVRVKSLRDIFTGVKEGFGLQVRPVGKKRYSVSAYMPFYFTDESEADLAAELINTWSKT